jgi:hypothetical protein
MTLSREFFGTNIRNENGSAFVPDAIGRSRPEKPDGSPNPDFRGERTPRLCIPGLDLPAFFS